LDSLISIKTSVPTTKSPAAFFISFFESQKIIEAERSFISSFPNPNEENDYWSSFCTSLLPNRKGFEVEYFVQSFDDEGDWPTTESVVVTYTFDSELEKLFHKKYQEFKKLFNEKFSNIESAKNRKSQIEYIRDLQLKVIKICYQVDAMESFHEIKSTLHRPLFAIIRFIHINYKEYALKPNVDKFIQIALKSKSETAHFIGEPFSLNSLLTLEVLRGPNGKKLFKFPKDENDFKDNLEHFYFNRIGKISSPIQINGRVLHVGYLIHKICTALDYSITDIAKAKIFMINTSFLIPNYCYTDANRVNTNIKDIIDLHFQLK
jgi:hypothetical protein